MLMPFTGHVRKRATKSGITTYQIIVEEESDAATGKRKRFYKTIKGSKKDAERAASFPRSKAAHLRRTAR